MVATRENYMILDQDQQRAESFKQEERVQGFGTRIIERMIA